MRLASRYTEVEFVLVGYGPLQDKILTLNKKLNYPVKIILDPLKAQEYLIMGDVFVLTSNREGLPMTMLEALYAGLIPLVPRVGGIPEIITDRVNGFLFDPRNEESLYKSMEDLLSLDSKKRAELKDKSRETVIEYLNCKTESFETFIKRYCIY